MNLIIGRSPYRFLPSSCGRAGAPFPGHDALRVAGHFLAGWSQVEGLFEARVVQDSIGQPRIEPRRDVLDGFAVEDENLAVGAGAVADVLVDEPLNMELPEDIEVPHP